MVPRGTLLVRRALSQPGQVEDEQLAFSSLQELLDLCARRTEGAAFVQVTVTGTSGEEQHTLVLDFGHFGRAG